MLHEAGNCTSPSVHPLPQSYSMAVNGYSPFSLGTSQVDTNEALGGMGAFGAVA